MKKALLSVSILLSTLSMVMGQRYISLNGSTAVGFTAIYPLAADVTTCGYFGGDGVVGTGSATATKYFTAEFNQNGAQIIKPSSFPADASYNKGIYIGITEPNFDCQSVAATSVNLSGSANKTLYLVAVNNTSNTLKIQSLIGDAGTGSTNNDYGNTFDITSNLDVYSFDYTGKFFCKYSCAGNPSNPVPVDASAINQFYFGVNGGIGYDGTDFTIKAVGVGYQTFEATQASVITTFTGANTSVGSTSQVQVATIVGGILTGPGTVSGSNVTGGSFEVSLSSTSGFASNVVLTPTSGIISPTVVYVRFRSTSGASAGTKVGTLTSVAPNTLPLVSNVTAVVSVATQDIDYQFSSLVSVAPNPSSEGYINVNTDLNVSNIAVMNAQGALVNAPVNGNRVNTSNLTPGVYTLLIDTEKGRTAKKVVVE